MPRPTATVSVVGGGDVKASVAVNINGDEVVNSALPPMQQPASAVMTVVGDGDVQEVNIGQEQRLRDVTPAVPQMDLESISKKDLMKICGIGHKLSKRLIDAREFQPFQSWEDVIRRVDLINTKRVELLQKHMTLRRCECSSP
jgi:DNA uptake protein ComE-like DNA-binding protein